MTPPPPFPTHKESSGMTVLRIITYVLCSLASLAVIIFVIRFQVVLSSIEDAFEQLGPLFSPFGGSRGR